MNEKTRFLGGKVNKDAKLDKKRIVSSNNQQKNLSEIREQGEILEKIPKRVPTSEFRPREHREQSEVRILDDETQAHPNKERGLPSSL